MEKYGGVISIEQIANALAAKFDVVVERVIPVLQEIAKIEGPTQTYIDFFEAALSHSADKALKIFESTSSTEMLLINLSMGGRFYSFCPLLLDLKELSVSVKEAISQLKLNRESLLVTGLSKFYSGKCTPIDVLSDRLYFVKCPVGIKVSAQNDLYEASFAWTCSERIIMKPLSLPPYEVKKYAGSYFKFTPDPETEHEITFGTDYTQGSVLFDLKDHADFLEAIRPRMYEAKLEVLNIIDVALQSKAPSDLLKNCVSKIAEIFTKEEVERLLRFDSLYANHHTYSDRATSSMTPQQFKSQSGGLSEVLWMIGHCEYEIKSKHIANIRMELGKLVFSHPTIGNCLWPRNDLDQQEDISGPISWLMYFVDATEEDRAKIEKSFVQFWSNTEATAEFWKAFSLRFDTVLNSEFLGAMPIQAKGKHRHLIELFSQQLDASSKLGLLPPSLLELIAQATDKKQRQVQQISAPPGTTWENVTFTLRTVESVEIKIKGQTAKTYLYSDLGFKNEKTNGPDRNWVMLRLLSKRKGEIVPAENRIKDVKKSVSDFRKAISRFLNLPKDPIPYDNRNHSYKMRSVLLNEIPEDRGSGNSATLRISNRDEHGHPNLDEDEDQTELELLTRIFHEI